VTPEQDDRNTRSAESERGMITVADHVPGLARLDELVTIRDTSEAARASLESRP
jgi:hypothetical protein